MRKRELIRNDRKYCRSSQTPVPAKRTFWIGLSLSVRGLSDNPRAVMGRYRVCFGGLRQQRRPPRRTRREATCLTRTQPICVQWKAVVQTANFCRLPTPVYERSYPFGRRQWGGYGQPFLNEQNTMKFSNEPAES